MASNTYRNPLSRTTRRSPQLSRELPSPRDLQLAEVLAVEYSGNRAGFIIYRTNNSENSDVVQGFGKGESGGNKSSNLAIPLFANLRTFPVIGEQVILIRLGNVYYIPVNALNNPVSNQVPFVYGSRAEQREAELTKAASATKNTFRVDPERKYYITGTSPGDVVLEGRFGNSIKLGSTVKSGDSPLTLYSKSDLTKNGDPIMIIRNGLGASSENIQKDAASIYLCSTQKILIDEGKNGFDGITGTWSTLNVSGQAIEVEKQAELTNTTATSPDSSRPGNPAPPGSPANSGPAAGGGGGGGGGGTSGGELIDPNASSGPVTTAPPSTGYKKPGNMTISEEGLKDLIREEGSRKQVYDDKTGRPIASYAEAQGYPTIGVGHLITKKEYNRFAPYLKNAGQMSDQEVQKLLLEDLGPRIRLLNNKLRVEVTQNMFDALLSMMFNTGSGNRFFKEAIRLTNEKKYQEAASVIKSGPTTSKGKVLAGLVRRRTNESNTYIA